MALSQLGQDASWRGVADRGWLGVFNGITWAAVGVMKVAIIGAGVAGCYCAYRLAASGRYARGEICLYEASERIGGRLFSEKVEGVEGSPMEFGGMFFGDKHENVFGLIKQLGLAKKAVDWSRRHQFVRGAFLTGADYVNASKKIPYRLKANERGMIPPKLLMTKLAAEMPELARLWPYNSAKSQRETAQFLRGCVVRGRPLCDWGFWNLLSELVSNEAYELLLASSPSASTMRNQNAYDAIWTLLFELEVEQDYYRLVEGYQSLPERLAHDAAAQGVTVVKTRTLKRVALGVGCIRLYFADEARPVETESVILALPRRALELIEFGEGVVDDSFSHLREAVMPVPACKLFLAFDRSWWSRPDYDDNDEADADIALSSTDLPMRKCYYFGNPKPGEKALLLATYADDAAASFWKGLRGSPPCLGLYRGLGPSGDGLCASHAMVASASNQLQSMHQSPIVVTPPTGAAFWDWSEDPYGAGWHAWKPQRQSWRIAKAMRQPNRALSLYTCGEAYASPQGWVEGAINNAEMLLERCFHLPRPNWVKSDYEFEIEEEEMSKLYDFLIKMSKDRDLLREYAMNSRRVMDEHGLTEEEQDALLSGSLDKIYAVAGSRGLVICKDVWVFDPSEERKKKS